MNLELASRRLDLLEDYLAQWGQAVDFSDIATFPDGPAAGAGLPVYPPQPGLGMSYPQAASLVYVNEAQLRAIRAESRAFSLGNPFCIGAQRNRIAYTVGKGHTYKCSLVDKDALAPGEGQELLERVPQCDRRVPGAESLARAAEGDRPPPGPRRRGLPAVFQSTPRGACCTSASSSHCAFRTWENPAPGSASSSSSTTTATTWRRRRPIG